MGILTQIFDITVNNLTVKILNYDWIFKDDGVIFVVNFCTELIKVYLNIFDWSFQNSDLTIMKDWIKWFK